MRSIAAAMPLGGLNREDLMDTVITPVTLRHKVDKYHVSVREHPSIPEIGKVGISPDDTVLIKVIKK